MSLEYPPKPVEEEEEPKTPWPPLFLPEGSVRALLALGIVGATIAMMYQAKPVDDLLQSLTATAIGFYFGSRIK